MAGRAPRRSEDVPGDFSVNDRCIACDTCRQLAPETFGGTEDEMSHVAKQPVDAAERRRALMALISCPVSAIGSLSKTGMGEATGALPTLEAPGVLRCGYASEATAGAASWLILRPEGNVLVDSPRFAVPLARRFHALGGVSFLFLTHRDDVGDHARWAREFGCPRVLHDRDLTADTRGIERPLCGDEPVPLAPDLLAIPVPGHTAGSTALLHVRSQDPRGGPYLFTGDHLFAEADGRLHASRAVCWWSWAAQAHSMARLAALEFEWVLPGHGRPFRASAMETRRAVAELAAEMAAGAGKDAQER